jgi:predicted alpha/beta hydrolase family esterase
MVHRVLLVPGIYNSGPRHWQSLWEQHDPAFVRVAFEDWEHPRRERWVETLESTLRELGPTTVVVAHSLGCLAVAHWASSSSHAPIHAALLVCVPDPLGPIFPGDAYGFAPVPLANFDFPSVIVASEDDPYSTGDHARRCASAWDSRLVNVGAKGHINADSNVGTWVEGRNLLMTLLPAGTTLRAGAPGG